MIITFQPCSVEVQIHDDQLNQGVNVGGRSLLVPAVGNPGCNQDINHAGPEQEWGADVAAEISHAGCVQHRAEKLNKRSW